MSSSADRRRPRVAGQRRRPGPPATPAVPDDVTPVPDDVTPVPDDVTPAPDDVTPARRRLRGVPRGLRLPAAALALSLLALAAVAGVSVGDPAARERDSRAATAAARTALEQLLSYDHETIATTVDTNGALLTGGFRQEYASTMRTRIAPLAQQEKAVVRARTYEAGVVSRSADEVVVQVFLNQARTAAGQDQPAIDQNRVIATMRRVDGRWLVARLSAY